MQTLSPEHSPSTHDFNLQTHSLRAMEAVAQATARYGVVLHLSHPEAIEWSRWNHTRRTRLCPQQISLHSPGEMPAFRLYGSAEVLEVTFSASTVARFLGTANEPAPALRDFYGFEELQVSRLLTLLATEKQNGGYGGNLFSEGILTALVAHLFTYHRAEQTPFAPASFLATHSSLRLSKREVEAVRGFIEAHLADNLSLPTLAALTPYSVHHFSLLFRETLGVSPHQFVTRRRVERAGRLLLSSDLPLAEIALAVGFAHQSHLNLHFKRIMGVTPYRYRRGVSH